MLPHHSNFAEVAHSALVEPWADADRLLMRRAVPDLREPADLLTGTSRTDCSHPRRASQRSVVIMIGRSCAGDAPLTGHQVQDRDRAPGGPDRSGESRSPTAIPSLDA